MNIKFSYFNDGIAEYYSALGNNWVVPKVCGRELAYDPADPLVKYTQEMEKQLVAHACIPNTQEAKAG